MNNRSRWNFLGSGSDGTMSVDGISVKSLVEKYGTPLYVLVEDEIRGRFKRFRNAFPYKKLEVQYAAKCNTNLEILKIAREEGAEIDASSIGEIILAMIADFRPSQITFTNLYKTEQDIFFAAKVGVKAITIDSPEEIDRIEQVGAELNQRVRVFIRINPQIKVGSYSTIYHKYGIPYDRAKGVVDAVLSKQHLELIGLHFHGSYISTPRIYSIVAEKLLKIAKYCKEKGTSIKYIDLGGGFPVQHDCSRCFQPEDMGKTFVEHFRKKLKENGLDEPTLIFEPGKFIVANSGIGLVKVISIKDLGTAKTAITDGSTYAFVPDVLVYKWFYEILPASKMDKPSEERYDIAGCTCDAEDIIGFERKLPSLETGDILAIMDCGAYSNVLASNFNTLKRAAVVMVKDGSARLVRRRDRYAEMFAPELDVLRMADQKELKILANLARLKLQKLNLGNGTNGNENSVNGSQGNHNVRKH